MNIDEALILHDETCSEIREIFRAKNNDYTGGNSSEAFANFRLSESLGIPATTGIMIRILDKIQRLITFTKNGELKVSNESAEDAAKDIMNYLIILIGIMKEDRLMKPILSNVTLSSGESIQSLKIKTYAAIE